MITVHLPSTLRITSSGSLQVTKLAEYFAQQGNTSAHQLMDRRFGYGLRWTTGSKD